MTYDDWKTREPDDYEKPCMSCCAAPPDDYCWPLCGACDDRERLQMLIDQESTQ